MIHRDIKPGNILCSGNTWKVSDFGLVTDDLINGYAAAAGYSDHIAPEVWDRHLTSVKSDVWALGMTVYRLLNGHAFYSEHFIKRGRDLPEEIRQGRFALKLPWLQHVPKAWKSFVRRAMNDDTDQRFQNIHDLAQALGQLSITPAWKCMFTPKKTVWTREKNNRQWEVQWVTHSVRKHTWSAISRGGKRDKVLGLSKCQVSRSQLDSELIEFFQKAR
jgi:serine/threonine-protein kinase